MSRDRGPATQVTSLFSQAPHFAFLSPRAPPPPGRPLTLGSLPSPWAPSPHSGLPSPSLWAPSPHSGLLPLTLGSPFSGSGERTVGIGMRDSSSSDTQSSSALPRLPCKLADPVTVHKPDCDFCSFSPTPTFDGAQPPICSLFNTFSSFVNFLFTVYFLAKPL